MPFAVDHAEALDLLDARQLLIGGVHRGLNGAHQIRIVARPPVGDDRAERDQRRVVGPPVAEADAQ